MEPKHDNFPTVYYNKVCPAPMRTRLRLATVLVVVARWSIDLIVTFIISSVLYIAMIDE